MFQTVMRLVLAYAYPICEWSDVESAQIVLSHEIHNSTHRAFPCLRREVLRAAEQFVNSSAWSMIWTRIQHEWVAGETLPASKLTELEDSLCEHFQPIMEMSNV